MVKEKSYSLDRKTLIETRMFFHKDQTIEISETDLKDELIAKGQSLEQLDRYEVKIGTFKGSARAFMEVSEALGHNRLDVLAKYV